MTIFDYVLNVVLIGRVARQLRGRRLDTRALLLPVAIVVWAASRYLHGIPTAGNDLVMVIGGAVLGVTLGAASASLTRLHLAADGVAVARATLAAVGFWVFGFAARMGFALYATHGGGPSIARFSAAHHLTIGAWVTGLVLMSFAEVLTRTLVLWARSRTVVSGPALAVTAG